MPLNATLFPSCYFPEGSFAPITIPSAVVDEVSKGGPTHKMTGFHDGMPEAFETVESGNLKIVRSPEHAEKMIAFVTSTKGDKKTGLIVFGRKALTNFGRSDVDLVPGVNVYCSEQLFKLCCASAHSSDQNLHKVMLAILMASKPFDAKKATFGLEKFDPEMWDAMSPQAMFLSTVMRCKHEPTFRMFKQCIGMMRSEGVTSFLVIEANNDNLWGINRFTKPFLDALCADSEADQDLIAAALKQFDGVNQLGTVLTDFMLAIEGMEYGDYMAALEGVEFAVVA